MLCLETQYSPCSTKEVRIETVRAEVERAMMEDNIKVLEDAVRIISKWKARVEAMRVERGRQVKAEWQTPKEEEACM